MIMFFFSGSPNQNVIYVCTDTILSFKKLTDFIVKYFQPTAYSKRKSAIYISTEMYCKCAQQTSLFINLDSPKATCSIEKTEIPCIGRLSQKKFHRQYRQIKNVPFVLLYLAVFDLDRFEWILIVEILLTHFVGSCTFLMIQIVSILVNSSRNFSFCDSGIYLIRLLQAERYNQHVCGHVLEFL